MDEKTLLDFIQKIIVNTKANKGKTENVLTELKTILESQHIDPQKIEIVQKSINAIPEIYDLAGLENIGKGQIEKAYSKAEARRAEERRLREEAYRNHGRC